MDFKKSAWLAGYFTIAMVALNYLLNMIFGLKVQSLFAITEYPSVLAKYATPTQPFSGSIGERLAGFIGNYLPIDLPTIALLFISAFILILAGEWVVGLGAPVAKGRIGKLFSVVAYGTIIGYLIMVGTAIPAMNVILGTALYVAAAAYLTALLGNVTGQNVA